MNIAQTNSTSKQSGNAPVNLSLHSLNLGPGNIVPNLCYHKVMSCGKPDFVGITILSELLFLHRLNEGEELANGYAYFERKFNLTRTQLQEATLRLHKSGLVERSFRTVLVHGHKIPSILHLKLNIDALKALMPNSGDKSNNNPENGSGADVFDNQNSVELSLNNKQEFFYVNGLVNSHQADLEIPHPQLNKISIRKSRSSGSSFGKFGRSFEEFHPLDLSDVRSLQAACGRDFDSNFCNQLLLRVSDKYPDYKFPTKTAFMNYMSKMLQYELRDAVVVSNGSFRFKDSISIEANEAIAKEKYLESVESIRDTSLAGQLRRKIAGVFGVNLAYELLSNTSFYISGEDSSEFVVKSDSLLELSSTQHERLLGEVRSVYGENIKSLNLVFKNIDVAGVIGSHSSFKSLNSNNGSVLNKTSELFGSSRLSESSSSKSNKSLSINSIEDNSIWAKIRQSLRSICGDAIDRHWFSKLTPIVNDREKTITLKAPSGFFKDWIEQNYRTLIEKLMLPQNFKLAEVIV